MRAGLLFDGIGGFPLGFRRAGIRNVWSCEIDGACTRVLKRRFPEVTHYRDVARIGPWVKEAHGEVDVIAGGFPCQDISVAGHRQGLDGPRSKLWWEFHRVLDEQRPQWCVIENVAGLLTSGKRRDLGAILGSLGDVGYGWAYRVLDAQGFGVPQRRRRVIIVGCLGDPASAAEVLLEPESGGGDLEESRRAQQAATGHAGDGAGTDRRPLLADTGVVSALQSRMGTSGHGDLANAQAGWLIPDTVGTLTSSLTRRDNIAAEEGMMIAVPFRKSTRAHGKDANDETWVDDGIANTLNSFESSDIRTTHAVFAYSIYPRTGQGSNLAAAETEVATPLTATDATMHERGTRIVEEMGVRRLTPLECERLQGFPDNWTEGQPDTHRYKQLGNAVAVPMVEWIARRMKEVHERG